VITTLLPPHRFSPARLAELRAAHPAFLAGEDDKLAVLLGGPGGDFRYTDTPSPASSALASAQELGARAPSRLAAHRRAGEPRARPVTPPAVGRAKARTLSAVPRPRAFIVPADSISMTGGRA
jgi:mitochondrial fission protein ELM1